MCRKQEVRCMPIILKQIVSGRYDFFMRSSKWMSRLLTDDCQILRAAKSFQLNSTYLYHLLVDLKHFFFYTVIKFLYETCL